MAAFHINCGGEFGLFRFADLEIGRVVRVKGGRCRRLQFGHHAVPGRVAVEGARRDEAYASVDRLLGNGAESVEI